MLCIDVFFVFPYGTFFNLVREFSCTLSTARKYFIRLVTKAFIFFFSEDGDNGRTNGIQTGEIEIIADDYDTASSSSQGNSEMRLIKISPVVEHHKLLSTVCLACIPAIQCKISSPYSVLAGLVTGYVTLKFVGLSTRQQLDMNKMAKITKESC